MRARRNYSGAYKYVLLTKHEVKMAGYWPSSLFAFLWTETNKSQKIFLLSRKIFCERKLSCTRLNFGKILFVGTKRAIPGGQYCSILPARVANQNTEFAAYCPLTELANYNNACYNPTNNFFGLSLDKTDHVVQNRTMVFRCYSPSDLISTQERPRNEQAFKLTF